MKKWAVFTLTVGTILLYLLLRFSFSNSKQLLPSSATLSTTPIVFGKQYKTMDCTVDGSLPDRGCTPGAIIDGATKEQICTPGNAKSVRNVPVELKKSVYEEYTIPFPQPKGAYEVDHLISLELGGSNDIANLWPEASDPRPGFHEKDMVENYLHDQVCNGVISLQDAQQKITEDWVHVYKTMQ